ncbi:hypothetical protein GCM10012288_24790 [Malaciobacter pacificus]|uniref:DUF4492 domain-containing protein n=1 Tax=Malaciobacter pacificus TaxID=1080223 RepID=A0A5C2H9H8_9BACT|nr:DUF4492 domain-containing protein [Malaciobacter pacificus]QEP35561.1 DUF4492 domain-containing protein [Malaciobacter pacificus]GGD49783.1 hypothetical protein GCM10012288_24790 [Malaciobacter pacificus]
MHKIKNIYLLYKEGFQNLTIGRILWKLIIIKLIVILLFLNTFVYDKTIKTEYKNDNEKIQFVLKNLIKDN